MSRREPVASASEERAATGWPSGGSMMVRSLSLADQVADAIVDAIAMGKLKPGQRLVETDLAKRLGVSRVPIREALKILETQGIVEMAPHRGGRVAEFSESRIDQICEVRVALERIAAHAAAAVYRKDPTQIARLDAVIARMEQATDRRDWAEASKADLDFHREICRASGNAVAATLWEALARHVMIVFGHEIRDEGDAKRLASRHRQLRDMLLGAPAELDAEIERHILRLRGRS
jgi:DNA-binding GntR family transcriptional regulator